MQINHKDGNKSNNHISNLEAVTPSENMRHAAHVLKTNKFPGINNPKNKLSIEDIGHIIYLSWHRHWKYRDIAEKFNISPSQVGRICGLEVWRCLWKFKDGIVQGGTSEKRD
jgi:hypothetical protein